VEDDVIRGRGRSRRTLTAANSGEKLISSHELSPRQRPQVSAPRSKVSKALRAFKVGDFGPQDLNFAKGARLCSAEILKLAARLANPHLSLVAACGGGGEKKA
jgi:hypothetical protein